MYILDTDICIYLIKKKSLLLLNKLSSQKPGQVSISAITLMELQYGVEKSQFPEKNQDALLHFLLDFQILSFDSTAAIELAKIRSDLERKGTVIGVFDMMIAAQARALNATLVTNNTKEFSRVPNLDIENWV
jgi:tRNA(fMet)-specific endonuclease VapC